jgi:hypothetical protein
MTHPHRSVLVALEVLETLQVDLDFGSAVFAQSLDVVQSLGVLGGLEDVVKLLLQGGWLSEWPV